MTFGIMDNIFLTMEGGLERSGQRIEWTSIMNHYRFRTFTNQFCSEHK
jgi:hypothetical protein